MHIFITHILLSFVSVFLAANAVGDSIKQECVYPVHFIPLVNVFVLILSLDLIYARYVHNRLKKVEEHV